MKWWHVVIAVFLGSSMMNAWSMRSAEQAFGPRHAPPAADAVFRLTLDVDYRGEPQRFDIVAACKQWIPLANSSGERTVWLTPALFGRRMSDGSAIVVSVPNACKGQTTANGKVPTDFMPLVTVYDDASRLDVGTAFVGREAYSSPQSRLAFKGAVIQAATLAEYEQSRRDGPRNLITREQYHSTNPAITPMARTCRAYARYAIDPEQQAYMSPVWPDSRPKYWTVADAGGGSRDAWPLLKYISRDMTRETDGMKLEHPQDQMAVWRRLGERGLPDQNGNGQLPVASENHTERKQPAFPSPTFYPVTSILSPINWPERKPGAVVPLPQQGLLPISAVRLGQDGANRGMAYCFNEMTKTGLALDPASEAYMNTRANRIQIVNGEIVVNSEGTSAPTDRPFFEEDKYLYEGFEIWTDFAEGDV